MIMRAVTTMAKTDDCLYRVQGVERHLFDGQRRTQIRLDRLELRAGRSYALCGPSGIGKTTALEMLALARKPDIEGSMSLHIAGGRIDPNRLRRDKGEDSIADLRSRAFGYVVQTAHLFPYLTVRENITLAQRISGYADTAHVEALMAQLQIATIQGSMPSQLSGGQRQRVCIARALAHRPSVILADEPTSAVDQEMAAAIMNLLTDFARSEQAALLVITHNVMLVERFGLEALSVASDTAGGLQRTRIGQAFLPAQPTRITMMQDE